MYRRFLNNNDYLGVITREALTQLMEKPLNFDPFGHAELSLFAKI